MSQLGALPQRRRSASLPAWPRRSPTAGGSRCDGDTDGGTAPGPAPDGVTPIRGAPWVPGRATPAERELARATGGPPAIGSGNGGQALPGTDRPSVPRYKCAPTCRGAATEPAGSARGIRLRSVPGSRAGSARGSRLRSVPGSRAGSARGSRLRSVPGSRAGSARGSRARGVRGSRVGRVDGSPDIRSIDTAPNQPAPTAGPPAPSSGVARTTGVARLRCPGSKGRWIGQNRCTSTAGRRPMRQPGHPVGGFTGESIADAGCGGGFPSRPRRNSGHRSRRRTRRHRRPTLASRSQSRRLRTARRRRRRNRRQLSSQHR